MRREIQSITLPEEAAITLRSEGLRAQIKRDHTIGKLRLLWGQRRILLKFVAIGLVVSTIGVFVIPKRYRSTTRLMPPDDQSGSSLAMAAAALTGRGSALGNLATDVLGIKSTSDLFVGILGSDTVQDHLINRFNLKKVYWDRTLEDARADLADHTDVSVDRKSQIITIAVIDKDKRRAAQMGQAYVQELNELVAELSTSSARRERIFLEGRLKGVNQDLETAEKEFSQFASKNTAIDVPAQGRAMVEAAAVLQGQLIAAQAELEGLRQIYADGNVRVRSVAARVAELQDQLEKLGGKGEVDPSGPGQTGQLSEPVYPSIRRLPLLGVAYADLYRKTRVEETVYEALTQEYELAKVQEAKEIPTVKVLDPPDVPDKRSFPPRMLLIFLGTLVAFSLGAFWIFARELWRTTKPDDPGKVLAQEVFSTISAHLPGSVSNGKARNSAIVTTDGGQ